jgi:hypothetical protein
MCSDIMLENSDSLFRKRDTFYVVVTSSLIFVTYGALLFIRVRGSRYRRGHVVCPLHLCGLK